MPAAERAAAVPAGKSTKSAGGCPWGVRERGGGTWVLGPPPPP